MGATAPAAIEAESLVSLPPPPPLPTCPPRMEMVSGGCTPTPMFVGGVELWLRADRGVQTTRGGRVVRWGDQSGNASHADVIVDGTGPVAITPSWLAPRHALRFARTGEWSAATEDVGVLAVDLSALAESADTTVMIVATRSDVLTNDAHTLVLGSGTGAAQCREAFAMGWTDVVWATITNGCEATHAVAWPTGDPQILTGRVRSGFLGAGHQRSLLVDHAGTGAVGTSFAPFLDEGPIDGRIGRGFGGSADTRFEGDVHEIVVFDHALEGDPDDATTELGMATSWLRRHWSI
ncbi:hypothetical protein DB32_006112 [Sandaracinus amylolyticus]|uniref:Uncharacterized protein n=1 Tax=Sandaracinus amylolyticus TaxID=927083 RepID=A0A0F6YL61_9BACT|nr:hypothetical protein DB32_006112 [Sandaracinus amylolyticus]